MMIQEFENLTGMNVSLEEYAVIEQMYYDFDGNKDQFCEKFVKQNLIMEVIRKLNDNKTVMLEDTVAELEVAQKEIDRLNGEISRLNKKLEEEQEWKPWFPERAVKQEAYDHLKRFGHEMTDEEAKQWISDEFGFAPSKIGIHRKMAQQEINRHHRLRTVGKIDRDPYYDATDWYYVFFTVCGSEYEAYNGTLIQL